ncbi:MULTISPECIES: hypothetical protein [unclassified Streptomyces]|uniref:SCO2584 family spore wall biosynthesis protein n=1 Tax=unclassified Streptomyces TaxID=2593676 RepID=UPI0037FAF3FF
MPDDVGGEPFPNGWEPDDDRGGADEDFASVVFDEDFVRAAEIHEPSAVERLLAAAQARAEAEAARARAGAGAPDEEPYDEGYGTYHPRRDSGDVYGPGLCAGAEAGPYGRHGGVLRPYRGRARWHRPIAWLLAVLMGIGMVALAFSAVYRGASSSRDEKAPPAPAASNVDTSGAVSSGAPASPGGPVGPGGPVSSGGPVGPRGSASPSGSGGPSASADYGAPAVSAAPRMP